MGADGEGERMKGPDGVIDMTGDVITKIERLNLKDTDVVVIQADHMDARYADHISEIFREWRERTGCQALVLLTEGVVTIRSLDEDEMRRHGWVRATAPGG